MSTQKETRRLNLTALNGMKREKLPITALTAYDYSFACLLDQCGIDIVLVGDSLGMVIQGHETTIPVTMDDMLYHTRIVSKGLQRAMLIMDMPFMSYATPAKALENATRALQIAGAHMVKLEGGLEQVEIVRTLAQHDIPVCAHIGLKPQSIYKTGSYRVQGRDQRSAAQMLESALALEKAGADLLLVECVPQNLAAEITTSTNIPVIGIGAGAACDGQILVLQDLLGITPGKPPRFARNYMEETSDIASAITMYVNDVRTRRFPDSAHSFD